MKVQSFAHRKACCREIIACAKIGPRSNIERKRAAAGEPVKVLYEIASILPAARGERRHGAAKSSSSSANKLEDAGGRGGVKAAIINQRGK